MVERRGFIWAIPALAIMRVRGPSFVTVSWIRVWTSVEEVTSAVIPMARGWEGSLLCLLLISVTKEVMSEEAAGMSFMQTL